MPLGTGLYVSNLIKVIRKHLNRKRRPNCLGRCRCDEDAAGVTSLKGLEQSVVPNDFNQAAKPCLSLPMTLVISHRAAQYSLGNISTQYTLSQQA